MQLSLVARRPTRSRPWNSLGNMVGGYLAEKPDLMALPIGWNGSELLTGRKIYECLRDGNIG